jgi:exodeoxyribonuclease V alpha subunit
MAEHTEHFGFLKDLFPRAGPDLLRLLQGAAENAYLLRSDFYAMRDWLEIANYVDDEDVPHAILLLMLVALEEGSLCIEVAEPALLRRLADLVPAEEAASWAKRLVQSVGESGFPALIGTSPLDHKPVIVHAIGTRRFLYFQKYLRAELDFQRDLRQKLEQQAAPTPAAWPDIIREVARTQPLKLDVDQQRALETALSSNFTIISGGPGTGKTSIVLTLLRCLIRGGYAVDRIALAAPTGRAAQRLSDALRAGLAPLADAAGSPDARLRDLTASTLHGLLGYRPSRNTFSRHRENPVPADVVIVDEVSMVGLVLMAQLLEALAPATRLVLLGDKDQLPSVDAGAVLAQLVESADQPEASARPRVVLLQTNHRSQQQIREVAQAINQQDASIVDRLPRMLLRDEQALDAQAGCFLLEQSLGTANELRGFLQQWADQAYFRSRQDGKTLAEMIDGEISDRQCKPLFALLDRFRLLTLVRDSAWGCDDINEFLRAYLRPRLDGDARIGLFAGAPVLITRNDPSRGLFNGDVGMTVRSRAGLQVLFPREGGAMSFPAESLPAHELGFALTVHKSQGSEYQNVMLVMPPKGGKRLLTKELIYTAITRAKSLAIICGDKDVLKFAIGRRIVRESGILV